ncbi:hypothetical protein EUGRSUZ_C01777 [Eucalyptus grandis]|uniref:Uncharacterized protein n=2 Tax=Eucalyptus grandis TaxID=71139 RepID=A0A059CQJ5_EUCGR|nr:hypothetical protein EUGRSUZ_C01777 [Eucalyptus grandis]
MEDHKLQYLQSFLGHNQNCRLEDYIKRIRSWEDRTRSCYDKQIDLSSDEFTKMTLLDGIFVIQTLNDVHRDMKLLENQMQQLFQMAFGSHQKHTLVLLELTYGFFGPGMKMEEVPESVMESEVKRFLDAIRLSYLPEEVKLIPSVTELVAARVELKRVNSPANSKLLIDLGIIKTWLGNEDAAADLINSFCKDTFLWTRNAYFYSLRHELVAYCQRRYNKVEGIFEVRNYCSSPWAVLLIITAVVLLTLTVV